MYLPEGGAVQTIPGGQAQPPRASTTEERVAFGQRVYTQNCVACHPAEGQGAVIVDGADAILFGYGPVLLSQAYLAAGGW